MNGNKNNRDNGSYGLPIGMCIGLSIGTAIGAATNNLGLWIPIGLSVGSLLGLVVGHNSEDDNDSRKGDKQ